MNPHATQDTSLESFDRLKDKLPSLEKALLNLYRLHGPLTDKECAEKLSIHPSTLSGIRNPLVKRGTVEKTGQRRGGGLIWRLAPLPPSMKPESQKVASQTLFA